MAKSNLERDSTQNLFIISPQTAEIIPYEYQSGDTFQAIISDLQIQNKPTNLLYYNGVQAIHILPDYQIEPFFPSRQSQVLIYAFTEPKQPFPLLTIPSGHILLLLIKEDLQQVIPLYLTANQMVNSINQYLLNQYNLTVNLTKTDSSTRDEFIDENLTIDQLLPRRTEPILLILKSELLIPENIPERVELGKIFVQVSDFGKSTTESFEHRSRLWRRTFYINAIARGINMKLPLAEIKRQLVASYPSPKWQENNLLRFTELTPEEKSLIMYYTSFAFQMINDYYRTVKKAVNPNHFYNNIERAIEKMPPLDKEIIVFRYVGKGQFLPMEIGSVVSLKGYLSTTVDASFLANEVCPKGRHEKKPHKIMIIQVPPGKKAIFIPSGESELIFPLNTTLRLNNYQAEGQFPCLSQRPDTYYIYNLPIYWYTML